MVEPGDVVTPRGLLGYTGTGGKWSIAGIYLILALNDVSSDTIRITFLGTWEFDHRVIRSFLFPRDKTRPAFSVFIQQFDVLLSTRRSP